MKNKRKINLLIIIVTIFILSILMFVITTRVQNINNQKKAELEKENLIFEYEIGERKENNVKIFIKVSDKVNGLERLNLPDGDAIIFKGTKEEKGIDYEVKMENEYKFVIISENGDSTEKIIKIDESMFSWKKSRYPVLSENKINNMEYSDQYGNALQYKRDLDEGACTANDALPIEAWDDNTGTAVRTGTYYIKIADNMIGKTLVWTQYWTSGCTSIFTYCDKYKNELNDKWWSDVSGSRTIVDNAKYLKYFSNGHYLYEIFGK